MLHDQRPLPQCRVSIVAKIPILRVNRQFSYWAVCRYATRMVGFTAVTMPTSPPPPTVLSSAPHRPLQLLLQYAVLRDIHILSLHLHAHKLQ